MPEYYVYIMASVNRTLYIGVTSDLEQRVIEHKSCVYDGFTSRYNITKLVWFENFTEVDQAIEAEKRMKKWRRSKKLGLIEADNPTWDDLARGWGDHTAP